VRVFIQYILSVSSPHPLCLRSASVISDMERALFDPIRSDPFTSLLLGVRVNLFDTMYFCYAGMESVARLRKNNVKKYEDNICRYIIITCLKHSQKITEKSVPHIMVCVWIIIFLEKS
jgi:hypothetical protein